MNADELNKLKKMFGIGQKKTIVESMTSVPKRDEGLNVPTTDVFEDNVTHQADLLKLPEDKGHEYCLVVVDLHSRYIGAVPLKNRESKTVFNALMKIYKDYKTYLKLPNTIECDQGAEFKGDFKAELIKKGVRVVYKMTGRHRSQAMVETYNGILAKYLIKRQLATEINMEGEELNGDWVDDLPNLVKVINEIRKAKGPPVNKERLKASHNGETPIGEGSALNLLPLGSTVRRALDEPRDIQGSKLHGTFRKGDIRWSTQVYEIVQYSLRPNQPPMYLLDGIKNASFTKNQLQIVKNNEQKPPEEMINKYIVEKIVSKKKDTKGKKWLYEIKWKGYGSDRNTFQTGDTIPSSFIEEFEKNNKKRR